MKRIGLLPEEEDRRKLLLIAECFKKIPDKWAYLDLVFLSSLVGVRFNRYSSLTFKSLPDFQIIYNNAALEDLNCLLFDNAIIETESPESITLSNIRYILSSVNEIKKTYSKEYSLLKKLEIILRKNGIYDSQSLYLLSELARGSEVNMSQEALRKYKRVLEQIKTLGSMQERI